MINTMVKIIAKSPPAILLALGGVGLLFDMNGAGLLLGLGMILQLVWLGFMFL